MERATRQRDAIRTAIETAKRPLSPREVQQEARCRVPGLGLATVYRNLKSLTGDGVVRTISLPGERPRYEAAESPHHHHHFKCVACRRVFDIPGCPGNLRRLAPRGFRVEHHDITLYGRCSDCNRRSSRPAR
jgi:Fur family transcriptional regulator, ferric uptake regulator